jgi:MinD superfamily P-loop ATPase
MQRVLELAKHFEIRPMVCVNRWDLHPESTERIEEAARHIGAELAGRVRYDPSVTAAQVAARSVVECGGGAAEDLRALWHRLQPALMGAVAPY